MSDHSGFIISTAGASIDAGLRAVNGRIELLQLSDYFDDGVIGPQWEQYNAGFPATETSKANMSLAAGDGAIMSGLSSVATYFSGGDFDFEVDFSSIVLGGVSGKFPCVNLRFLISGDDFSRMAFMRLEATSNYVYGANYRIGGAAAVWTYSASVSATSNVKFRLRRVGSTAYMYYFSLSGWVLLKSIGGFSTAAGNVQIDLFNTSTTSSASADNLVVTVGTHMLPTSPTATLVKLGGGAAGQKWKWNGSGLIIPENVGITGATAPNYQYGLFDEDNESDLSYNGSWLTQANLKAGIGTTAEKRWLKIKANFPSGGAIPSAIGAGYIPAAAVITGGGGGGTKSRFAQALGVKEGFR